MRQRVITAIVALIIFIPIILLGGVWIDIAGIALGIVAISEILVMKKKLLVSTEAFISYFGVATLIMPESWLDFLPVHISQEFFFFVFVLLMLLLTVLSRNLFSFDDAGVLTLGMLYIGTGFHYFIVARSISLVVLLYALFIVWSTDSGAYIFGRMLGRHKLAPRISPNKTWEGSISGTILATVICTLFIAFYPIFGYSTLELFFVTVVLSIAGQFGDLIESALKRYYGVKDSGKILPGHGGILDRFDSLLFVLPILHLIGIV